MNVFPLTVISSSVSRNFFKRDSDPILILNNRKLSVLNVSQMVLKGYEDSPEIIELTK